MRSALLLLCALAAPLAAQTGAKGRIAVTIDDLPAVQLHDSAHIANVTTRILDALEAHAVTAVGFVNSGKIGGHPDSAAFRTQVLRRWLAAGHALGNHGAYHMSANDVPLHLVKTDVLIGDSLPRRLSVEAGRPYRWFRAPYLHTGQSDAVRFAIDSLLDSLGTPQAPITVDSRDWLFHEAVERALAKGDTGAARTVEAEYVDYVDSVLVYHERLAKKVMKRDIPHVLLLHANAFTARTLDALLARLHAKQYAFISLDAALADKAYRQPDRYRGHVGFAWLQRHAIYLQGVRIDDHPMPSPLVQALGSGTAYEAAPVTPGAR